MSDLSAGNSRTPILPAHIEDTIAAIAKLHSDHERGAGILQRYVERMTAYIGGPRFVAALAVITLSWVLGNLASWYLGVRAWDPPPFNWMETITSVFALYVTVLILTTQRRDDQIATYREQLTLELAILAEQKSAKIIALLEEIRQEHPHLKNRADSLAAEMAIATDPEALIHMIKQSAHEEGS